VSEIASSNILGIRIFRCSDVYSIQGLVLTSISQTLRASSRRKSYPYSSKQLFDPDGLRASAPTDYADFTTSLLICSCISSKLASGLVLAR
jgi:hypothetical protein